MTDKTVHATNKPAAAKFRAPVAALAGSLAVFAPMAMAYVGPGAGLGMIASLFAVLLAVIATIVGLVLWPLRKLTRRKKAAQTETDASKPDGGG